MTIVLWIVSITHSNDSNRSSELCYDKKQDEDGKEIADNKKLAVLKAV